MYIDPPVTTEPVAVPPALALVILACALAIVLLGLYPRPLLDTTLRAAAPLF
jgi:NADH:ubiquinone oxidoreductase subunit 2 (subunit N)